MARIGYRSVWFRTKEVKTGGHGREIDKTGWITKRHHSRKGAPLKGVVHSCANGRINRDRHLVVVWFVRETRFKIDNSQWNKGGHVRWKIKYLGQAFTGDSHLHVISTEFKKNPFCTFLSEKKKKRQQKKKKVRKWREGREELGI